MSAKEKEELFEAQQAVYVARNHFENAAPEYIDESIYRLAAAEKRLNTLLRYHKAAA